MKWKAGCASASARASMSPPRSAPADQPRPPTRARSSFFAAREFVRRRGRRGSRAPRRRRRTSRRSTIFCRAWKQRRIPIRPRSRSTASSTRRSPAFSATRSGARHRRAVRPAHESVLRAALAAISRIAVDWRAALQEHRACAIASPPAIRSGPRRPCRTTCAGRRSASRTAFGTCRLQRIGEAATGRTTDQDGAASPRNQLGQGGHEMIDWQPRSERSPLLAARGPVGAGADQAEMGACLRDLRAVPHRVGLGGGGDRKRTERRYKIDVFPASQLGKETDINQGLTLGTVDIIISGSSFAAREYPPIGVTYLPLHLPRRRPSARLHQERHLQGADQGLRGEDAATTSRRRPITARGTPPRTGRSKPAPT